MSHEKLVTNPDRKDELTKYTSRVTYERPSSRDRIENAIDPEAGI
jgi:hypothetical protein